MAFVLAILASMVGTILQRVSGTGVALVAAPFLSAFFGPVDGILITNLINGSASALLCVPVLKDIHWRRFATLAAFALVGEAFGAMIVSRVPVAWMQCLVGGTVVLAMAATWLSGKKLPFVRTPLAAPITGFFGGILMATAGLGAPATVIYARLIRWDQRAFAATMQPLFSVMATSSFFIKRWLGVPFSQGWLNVPNIVLFLLCMVLAVRIGSWLSLRMSSSAARDLAFLLAAIGAMIALWKGVAGLMA